MSNTVSNTLLLVAAAVAQKLIVFVINQLSLSYTSPEVIGQAAIQLELWLSTSLFISREAIRITCLRYKIEDNDISRRHFINLSWLPFFLVVAITTTMLFFTSSTSMHVYYLYSLAAGIETLGEPLYNLYNNQVYIEPRIRAETLGFFIKSIVTFATVAYGQLGIIGFGLAQLSFSIVYLMILISYFSRFLHKQDEQKPLFTNLSSIFPSFTSPFFHEPTLQTTFFLSASSIVKHFLTEADKISLTISCTAYDQGIYAITNNYGSLIARLLYLPLEDSARLSFSHLNKQLENQKKKNDDVASSKDTNEDIKTNDGQDTSNIQQLLQTMLKIVLFVGIGIATFGPSYVPIFTSLLFRANVQNMSAVTLSLTYYCYYLCLMGINGIAEAFLQVIMATSSSQDFLTNNMGFIVSSAMFASTAYYTVSIYGSAGIILANIASVAVRLLWNSALIAVLLAIHASRNTKIQQEKSGSKREGLSTSFLKGIYFLSTVIAQPWWWSLVIVLKVIVTLSSHLLFRNEIIQFASRQHQKKLFIHLGVGAGGALLFVIGTFRTCSLEEQSRYTDAIIRRIPIVSLRNKLKFLCSIASTEVNKKEA